MRRSDIRHCIRPLAAAVLIAAVARMAPAQTPTFQPLMTGNRVTSTQYVAGHVFAGLPKGGLVVWNAAAGTASRTLTRHDGLGGHFVNDLAWTGVNLWVATGDGGLTSISNPAGPSENMRQYSSLLSSLNVTAVSGLMIGDTERVFYGTSAAGIGEIVSGLPGSYLTTQDGLIDDTIDALALASDILLIATPVGLSRFANNTFTSYPYNDPDVDAIRALEMGPDGWIWSASDHGVSRWNDQSREWEVVNGSTIFDLAVDGDTVWALSWQNIVRIVGDNITSVPLPSAPSGYDRITHAVAAGDGEVWAGGRLRATGQPSGTLVSEPWVAPGGDAATTIEPIDSCQPGYQGGFDGTVIDSRGRPWLGDREGDGLAGLANSGWYNAIEQASVANDSNGFFDYGGGFLDMVRDEDSIWTCQFTRGAVRFTPAAEPGGEEDWLLLEPENSPILGDGVINIGVHPDRVILFGTDAHDWSGTDNSSVGVEVLVDQSRPRDEESWVHVITDSLRGPIVTAIGVERLDVIWFAVANVGLRRWDINGRSAGPDDPLTWDNQLDDYWTGFQFLPGSELDLAAVRAIVTGPDGSLFAGGSGLVQFTYDEFTDTESLVAEWEAKADALNTGLLHQAVTGLGFDHNGALWVLSEGGLNRLRFGGDRVAIDAFTDLDTYLTFDSTMYSPSIISELPGGTYRRLDVSADGTELSLSSDLGGALVSVPAASAGGDEDPLASAFLYPNPFPGETGADRLSIGGLEVADDALLDVEIFNLGGQRVFRLRGLESGENIWDGHNRQDRPVASGLYIVKLTYLGHLTTRTLAVTF